MGLPAPRMIHKSLNQKNENELQARILYGKLAWMENIFSEFQATDIYTKQGYFDIDTLSNGNS